MTDIKQLLINRGIINNKSANCLPIGKDLNNNDFENSDSIFVSDKNLQEDKPTCYLKQKPPVVVDKRGERENFLQKALRFAFENTCFWPDERAEELKEDFDYKITDNDKGYTIVKKKVGNKIEQVRFYTYDDTKYDINGEIDTEVKQGQMEDCGLVSLIYSIAQNDKGKALIKDSISPNYNENNEQDGYNFHFKGLNETYTITQSEIDAALNKQLEYFMDQSNYFYARGDKDMVLFEIAWNKCCMNNSEALNSIKSQNIYHFFDSDYPEGLSGTYQYKLFYALTGETFNENPLSSDEEIEETCNALKIQRKESIKKHFSENNEFKLSDFSITQESVRCVNSENETTLELNSTDSYIIIDENTDENTLTIKNKNTDEVYHIDKNEMIDTMVRMSSAEETGKIFDMEYQKAIESDVVTIGTNSEKCVFTDINGKKVKLVNNHMYGVKSVDENQIILVNPWDTEESIVLSKEELKKQFNSEYWAFNSKFKLKYGNIEN